MSRQVACLWVLAISVVMFINVVDVKGQAFQAIDSVTDQFSSTVYHKVGYAVGIIGAVALVAAGFYTSGHGTAIIIGGLFYCFSLFFLFGAPTYIFPLFGYTP